MHVDADMWLRVLAMTFKLKQGNWFVLLLKSHFDVESLRFFTDSHSMINTSTWVQNPNNELAHFKTFVNWKYY